MFMFLFLGEFPTKGKKKFEGFYCDLLNYST